MRGREGGEGERKGGREGEEGEKEREWEGGRGGRERDTEVGVRSAAPIRIRASGVYVGCMAYQTVDYDPFIKSQLAPRNQL